MSRAKIRKYNMCETCQNSAEEHLKHKIPEFACTTKGQTYLFVHLRSGTRSQIYTIQDKVYLGALGKPGPTKTYEFSEKFRRGGWGSFPIQKFVLQNLDFWTGLFWHKNDTKGYFQGMFFNNLKRNFKKKVFLGHPSLQQQSTWHICENLANNAKYTGGIIVKVSLATINLDHLWKFGNSKLTIVGNVSVNNVFTWTFMTLLILCRCPGIS